MWSLVQAHARGWSIIWHDVCFIGMAVNELRVLNLTNWFSCTFANAKIHFVHWGFCLCRRSKTSATRAFTSHFENLVSPSIAHRIDVNPLKNPRMNRRFSSFLGKHEFYSAPSWRAVEALGCRTRGFSSQSAVSAKEALHRAKLTWESQNAGKKKSEAMLMYLVAMVTAMVGATYAAVPLYRKFCQATGYGGTVQRREASVSFRTCDFSLKLWWPNCKPQLPQCEIPANLFDTQLASCFQLECVLRMNFWRDKISSCRP